MSKTLSIDDVIAVIQKQQLSPVDTQAIIRALNARLKTKVAEKEPSEPKPKVQHVIIATADRSHGWAVSLPEDAPPQSALERVNAAAHAFNATKAGRKIPVTTIGQAFESVKRRQWQDAGIKVINKLMVPILVTNNVLSEPPSV